eukprot:TRINITY_DN13627_c0_g3_i2.p1 TRINITY_DN13627_c0_g3~~TRINITY_DN13627_c0_g3_i2.p1  ORF type:complete len:104 (+),score=12.71 TRINITY_DN13627_c0_g3_i2:66-377(+)
MCIRDSLYSKLGSNWALIAHHLNGRSGKQVRDRYLNYLKAGISNYFSSEDDTIIKELYTKFGSKWKEMTKYIKGRSENMIKNRFYTIIKPKIALDQSIISKEM